MAANTRVAFRACVSSRLLLFAAVCLPPVVGCFQPEVMKPDQLQRGYILLLPGVGNTTLSAAGIVRGLRDAGEDRAIDFDQWGYHPFGALRNLASYELNRQRAARLARKVADYRAGHPTQPITIIGFSGGGAMALFAAEALPKDVVVDRVIVAGAALAPDYDIRPALAHCQRGLVNFYSNYDWLLLGWGTRTFGTMDRKKTSAAGRRGFRSSDGRLLVSDGLTQIAWTSRWWWLGHDGGHLGWLARRWVRDVVAPVVKAEPTGPRSRPS